MFNDVKDPEIDFVREVGFLPGYSREVFKNLKKVRTHLVIFGCAQGEGVVPHIFCELGHAIARVLTFTIVLRGTVSNFMIMVI